MKVAPVLGSALVAATPWAGATHTRLPVGPLYRVGQESPRRQRKKALCVLPGVSV